jgi:hypothetical protein
MYVNEAFQYLADNFSGRIDTIGSVAGWMTIMECWNDRDPAMSGDEGGSARWTVALNKEAGAGQPWTWQVRGEYMQPDELMYDALIDGRNTTAPLPVGQWFTLDLFIARGEGANGRVVLTMTPDGGSPQVLIDVTGNTIYPGRPDLRLFAINVGKIYTHQAVMSWVLGTGRTLQIHYNDFKWWKS